MARFMDDKQPQMIPVVRRLSAIPELTNEYAHDSVGTGEYQEALEVFLWESVDKNIELPHDLIDDVRAISDELLPTPILNKVRELVPA